jgi:hypothetical protein
MGLIYLSYFVLIWHAFWLSVMGITWYQYDVHPVVRKLWYQGKFQLRRLRTRLAT